MESERMGLFSKVVGTHSEREVKRVLPIVDKIEKLEPDYEKLSDEQLKDKTREFKTGCQKGNPWMTFFRRHMPLSERHPSGLLACAITGCS